MGSAYRDVGTDCQQCQAAPLLLQISEAEMTEDGMAVVTIGKSADNNRKCVTQSSPVTCAPDAGKLGKRVNSDGEGDVFLIEQEAQTICAQRFGSGEGWGMNLQIKCALLVPEKSKTVPEQAKSPRASEACPERCKTCKKGGAEDGGVSLMNGACHAYCSSGGHCGTT